MQQLPNFCTISFSFVPGSIHDFSSEKHMYFSLVSRDAKCKHCGHWFGCLYRRLSYIWLYIIYFIDFGVVILCLISKIQRILSSNKGVLIFFLNKLFLNDCFHRQYYMVSTKRCAWGTCRNDSRYPHLVVKNKKGDPVYFHRFPAPKRSPKKRLRWITACHRGDNFV